MQSELSITEKSIASIVAAAIGDAMGWPFEFGRQAKPEEHEYWTKMVGSRFHPIFEKIRFGEYSDDTQLILSTARSILNAGSEWMRFLCQEELPAWLLYERGGGKATKMAAQQLAAGRLPWSSAIPSAKRALYFKAGGNGGAMRILPHAVVRRHDPFLAPELNRDAFLNTICTHGHPRAIIGAMLYANAAHFLLNRGTTLTYGELIEAMRDSANHLKLSCCERFIEREWVQGSEHLPSELSGPLLAWDQTVREVDEMLQLARSELKRGPLASDVEFLAQIGALDRKTNGAGTVCAVAAIFLTSRYAVDPIPGLSAVARLRGLDTDTVTSMTGALLGAVNGAECLAGIGFQLQDLSYIRRLAAELVENSRPMGGQAPTRFANIIEKSAPLDADQKLDQASPGHLVSLPGMGNATVRGFRELEDRSGKVVARSVELEVFKGQTIFIRTKPRQDSATTAYKRRVPAKLGVRFYTKRLSEIRRFYEDTLGLAPENFTSSSVVYAPNVVFAELGINSSSWTLDLPAENEALIIELSNFEELRLTLAHKRIHEEMGVPRSQRKMFIIRDPDGRRIEIFAKPIARD